MPFVEHYAVAPAGDSFVLAHVAGENLHRLPDVLAALEPVFGTPVYLRLAARCTLEPGHELDLRVFDEGSDAPSGELELVPGPLRPALEAVLTEFRGAPPPRDRPAWARPGWHAQAEAWAGNHLSQVRVWPLSAVLRGASGYMKAVFPLSHGSTRVPCRTSFASIRSVAGCLCPRCLARRCSTWAHARMKLCCVRSPSSTAHGRGAQTSSSHSGRRIAGSEARELAALPDTLVHGDFHPGNAFFDGDRAVIFDWSDACVAHPLFDLHLYLHELGEKCRRDELVEAYASGWNGDVDADTIRELLPLAAPLSCLHQAESYRAIEAACAPDDRWWFAREAERWRELACAVSG